MCKFPGEDLKVSEASGYMVHQLGLRSEGAPANVSEEQDGLASPSMPAAKVRKRARK